LSYGRIYYKNYWLPSRIPMPSHKPSNRDSQNGSDSSLRSSSAILEATGAFIIKIIDCLHASRCLRTNPQIGILKLAAAHFIRGPIWKLRVLG